jgi:hypothetical protein
MCTGLCKDCRHWETIEEIRALRLPVSDWNADFGMCRVANGESGNPERREQKCFAEDGEHYKACLRTKPDFGCVQFEAKE